MEALSLFDGGGGAAGIPIVLVVAAPDDFLYDDLAKDLGGALLLGFFCGGVAAAIAWEFTADVSPGRKLARPSAAASAPRVGPPPLSPFITLAILMVPSPAPLAPFFMVDLANDLGTDTTSFGAPPLPTDLAIIARPGPAPAGKAAEPFNVDDFAYDFGLLLAGGEAAELPFPKDGTGCLWGMPNAPPPAPVAVPPAVLVGAPLKEALAKDFGGAAFVLAAGVAEPFGGELLLANDATAGGMATAA